MYNEYGYCYGCGDVSPHNMYCTPCKKESAELLERERRNTPTPVTEEYIPF